MTKRIKKQLFGWGVSKTYRLYQAVAATKWSDVKSQTRQKIETKAESIANKIKRSLGY